MSSQNPAALNKLIVLEFDGYGFKLRPGACQLLKDFAQEKNLNQPDFITFLNDIIKNVQQIFKQNPESHQFILEEKTIEEALKLYKNTLMGHEMAEDSMLQESFAACIIEINAFKDYFENFSEIERRIFKRANVNMDEVFKMGKCINAGAESKIKMYFLRYLVLKQKLLRHPGIFFQHQKFEKASNLENQGSKIEITEIGSLLGSSGVHSIFGMISEPDSQQYILQDLYSSIPLNLTECETTCEGFLLPGSCVICKGYYKDGKFIVLEVNLPPLEDRSESPKTFSEIDLVGAMRKMDKNKYEILELKIKQLDLDNDINKKNRKNVVSTNFQNYIGIFRVSLNSYLCEKNLQNCPVVCLANFNLDCKLTMKKFEKMLTIYESKNIFPLAFVVMGEFLSFNQVRTENDYEEIELGISNFLSLLKKYPSFLNCYWIFVPAVDDIGLATLPKKGITPVISDKLIGEIPYFINSSNPCRLSILGKDFLFSRLDLLKEIRRKSIIKIITDDQDINRLYVNTILSQAHLSPVSLFAKPILWDYDPSLLILQQPDFMVLADMLSGQFLYEFPQKVYSDEIGKPPKVADPCFVFNPGNFGKHSTFTMVYPLLNTVHNGKVPD